MTHFPFSFCTPPALHRASCGRKIDIGLSVLSSKFAKTKGMSMYDKLRLIDLADMKRTNMPPVVAVF